MKYVKIVAFTFLSMFILTGCQSKNADEILKEALDKTNNSNSYKMEVRTIVGSEEYSFQEKTIGTYTKTSSHFVTQSFFAGSTMDVENYTVEKDNKLYQYSSGDEGNTWGYSIYDIPNMRESLLFLNSIVSITDTVKEVKTDLEGYKKLELVLDKKKANEKFSENSEIVGLDFSKDILVDVYIKDGYISKLELDFGDILNEEYKKDIEEYSMKFSYTDYEKVEEIEVPKDILEKAVLEEEEEK